MPNEPKKTNEPIEAELVETKEEEKKEAPSTELTCHGADNLIAKAIDKETPVETMEKLLAMRRELKAEYAREQFDNAMAEFQADCPQIKKEKKVMINNKVAYSYAPIDVIVKQVKGILKKHGFSYSIQTEVLDGKVKSICIVKHKLGHRENYEMEVPLGKQTGMMSASQTVAAASTFSKRYAFCNAFGILTGDEDDDGASTDGPVKTPPAIKQQINNTAQAQKQPTEAKKEYCARCYSKTKKKIEITPAEAKYSLNAYGFKLCRICQNEAKKNGGSKKETPKEQPKVEGDTIVRINQVQKQAILGAGKAKDMDEMAITAYLEMHGLNCGGELSDITANQFQTALALINNYKKDEPSA